jgi:hypothetical protein
MGGYGTTQLGQSGIGLRALALMDASTRWKPNGITIDWSKVSTLEAGRNQIYELELVAATDGTFTVTVGDQTTAALDHDITIALLEAAIEGLSTVGVGNVLVTGSAEDYVIEFVEDMGLQPVVMTVDGSSLTAADVETLTETQLGVVPGEATLLDGTVVAEGDKYIELGTVMAKVTATGKYAPADSTASDGRETMTGAVRGERFILDRPLIKSVHGDHSGSVFDAGVVFKDRLQIGDAYTGAPTEANLETMFPAVTFHSD